MWGCVTLRILSWRNRPSESSISTAIERHASGINTRHSQHGAVTPLTCQRLLEQPKTHGHACPLDKVPEYLQTARQVLTQNFSSKSATLLEKALGFMACGSFTTARGQPFHKGDLSWTEASDMGTVCGFIPSKPPEQPSTEHDLTL